MAQDLGFLRQGSQLFMRQTHQRDGACRMIGAHGTGGIGNAGRLHDTRAPYRKALPLDHGYPRMPGKLADTACAVADNPAQRGSRRYLPEQVRHRHDISPGHSAGVHQDTDGDADFHGVETDVIAEAVEFPDFIPLANRAV